MSTTYRIYLHRSCDVFEYPYGEYDTKEKMLEAQTYIKENGPTGWKYRCVKIVKKETTEWKHKGTNP